jgi:hypothetical protein
MPVGYQSLSGRAMWAQRALIALIVLLAVTTISDYLEYSLFGQDVITQDELDANDIRQILIGLLYFAAFVLTVVMFIRWFKRAYENLVPLGVEYLRFGPRWAIWSWFVPFLNLWRPKQIANDIWRGSDPDAPRDQGTSWQSGSVPGLVQWWWGVFIVSNFVDNFALRAYWNADDPATQHTAAGASMFADGLDLIGAVLALLVVRRATARQEERAARPLPPPDPAARLG